MTSHPTGAATSQEALPVPRDCTYDLSFISNGDRTWRILAAVVFLLIGSAGLLFGGLATYFQLTSGAPDNLYNRRVLAQALAYTILGLLLVALIPLILRRGPIRLQVSEREVTFSYPNGRLRTLSFDTPGLKWEIWRVQSGDPKFDERKLAETGEASRLVVGVRGRLALTALPLTNEAVDDILRKARALRLKVSERPDPVKRVRRRTYYTLRSSG